MGSFPYPRNGILKLDYEFILIFKKLGTAPKPGLEQKRASALTKAEWNEYFSGHWKFAGVKQRGHLAMFPEELPVRLIKMFSFVGDTVLDPFLGSGTTSLAARTLGRNSVGYEINHEFIPLIKEKLNVKQSDIEGTEYEFISENVGTDFDEEIRKLPYIFKDPHRLDKKIDPKKMQFGSRIDKSNTTGQEYYRVKEILSPVLIKLDNEQEVRLLGVKEKRAVNGDVMEFLAKKVKGKRVFLKFDGEKYDDQNRLLCYLYLKNKTFINAHLIREGLAEVDTAIDFKYKNKFLAIEDRLNGLSSDHVC